MVRAVGLEPTLLAERDFESRASTSFTTPALRLPYRAPQRLATSCRGKLDKQARTGARQRDATTP